MGVGVKWLGMHTVHSREFLMTASDKNDTKDKARTSAGFETVLEEELALLKTLREGKGISSDPTISAYQRARESNLAGLALSGGGIRSATFNLGVIQALARYGLLSKFDYLSTVSGGGFIGGWLSALLNRKLGKGNDKEKVVNQKAVEYFQSCLKTHPDDAVACDDDTNVGFEPVEHQAVRYLRCYSNYLTPRLGLSGDTLAVTSIFLRNFTLIQLTLISLVASVLVFAHLLATGSRLFELRPTWLISCWPFAGGTLLLIFAFWSAGRLLAKRVEHGEQPRQKADRHASRRVYVSVILPTLVAAWWLSAAAAIRPQEMHLSSNGLFIEALYWTLGGIVGYVAAWCLGYLGWWANKKQDYKKNSVAAGETASKAERPEEEKPKRKVVLSAVFSGALLGLLLFAAAHQIEKAYNLASIELQHTVPIELWHAVAFGPPIFILGLSFVVTVHVGIARRSFTEGEREWIARLGGLVLFATAAWVLPFVLILYATPFVHWLAGGGLAAIAVWAGGSGTGAWLARGPSTGAAQGGVKWKGVIARLAPWLFLIGLCVIVAHFTHIALLESLTTDGYVRSPGPDFSIAARSVMDQLNALPLMGTFLAFLLIFALFLLVTWRLDINLFSLHALYCNRLARAYLGASRRPEERKPNPFSGFDFEDDLKFSELARQRPIPIINTAINMTGGDDLAWQTRRAASFAFTPQWSGYETRNSQGKKIGAYRPTRHYAGNRPLGTLLAVSGAAASPNMGYHTSPAVAALMTAFNLRLGRWCGNPEQETWKQSSPNFALKPIFAELTGSANAEADWINLTDGGHFDNLGVYELIRRRCRIIVATDAGCDPKHFFEDLANTVRKCWTDLGVNIRFDELDPVHLKKDSRHSETHGAVGRIQYYDDGPDGVIIYLKSSMTGDEWPDIRQYADSHEGFPHETTADQFFDENQFEAYRHLGYKVAAMMAESLQVISDIDRLTIEKIANWLIPPAVVKKPVNRDWLRPKRD